ncbi:MAG: hypothetical protein JSS87_02025 [Acidobacteria bacterium]|nr:hypothetical protein [Acidobacteriota bacterium]
MRNYFNYFTEIEERFQQRRGSILMLSTIDWALIETWRECGIPLEAALRGIDNAFDKYEARKQTGRLARKKINGLAWCAQSVMQATEEMAEAAIGASPKTAESNNTESGFEQERIAAYLNANADAIERVKIEAPASSVLQETAARLRELAASMQSQPDASYEELERTLTVLEEKIFSALKLTVSAAEMERLHEEAARELAPHRSRMQAAQIRMVQDQFFQKRLLQSADLPRLSLFYMSHG